VEGFYFVVREQEVTCVTSVKIRMGVAEPFVSCNQETGEVTESWFM
jgi:hypothetical protein